MKDIYLGIEALMILHNVFHVLGDSLLLIPELDTSNALAEMLQEYENPSPDLLEDVGAELLEICHLSQQHDSPDSMKREGRVL